MDEVRRSLERLYDRTDLIADCLHRLADLAANRWVDDETRRKMAEVVHRLAEDIEELD